MVNKSLLSLFDRLSVNSVLTNQTTSNIGLLGTLGWIIASFLIFLPPLIIYFQGNYFQSDFLNMNIPQGQYYSGYDFKIALAFRNKLNDTYANHTEIIDRLKMEFVYVSYYDTYINNLQLCDQGEFSANTINPTQVEQCIKIPTGLLYDIPILQGYYSTLNLIFQSKCQDPFLCKNGGAAMVIQGQYLSNLIATNYYQIIFTSKIIDPSGQQKFQVHKIYSTQYNQINGFLPIIQFIYWQRQSFIDDSILPWKNNITHNQLIYSGKIDGFSATQSQAQTNGGLIQSFVQNQKYITYRYYKKLDFVIGMLGGGIFLVFLFFWVPFSYINRTLQKIKNAQQLLLEKQGLIVNENNLKAIKIPFTFILKNLIPGKSKEKDIIEQAQKQIDIIKLIKKLKVAHRNLQTNTINDAFDTKDIQFIQDLPKDFVPDRQNLKNLNLTLRSYQALKSSPQVNRIYENNLTIMSMKQSQNINQLCADDVYDKKPSDHEAHNNSCFKNFKKGILQFIKFFDIFGAKPMFDAQPYNSSCWGFFLTCLIIVLSVLTFALTIHNMNTVQMLINYTYQSPQKNNYQLKTGQNLRMAACFNAAALQYLQGANKAASLIFYSNSTKYGYQQIDYVQMGSSEYQTYFDTDINDPYNSINTSRCFKIADGANIPFGGSPQSINEAYFGFKVSPYCFGTPSACAAILSTTLTKYLNFVNYYSFSLFVSQNQYSPSQNRIVSGANLLDLFGSGNVLNATIYRQDNYYLDTIQLLDDSAHWFVRQPAKTLQKTINFNPTGDQNLQQFSYSNMNPDYVLKLRSSGNKKQVVLRNYKIDQLFGIMGGVFVFWYFFVHFFAKKFNHFKIRAKLAQILYREDVIDESYFIQFLHLTKIPIVCCEDTQIGQDLRRVKLTQKKIIQDLDYLELVKYVDNCYRLSSSFFNSIQAKDLSLIYFKEKIDQSDKVYTQVKTKADQIIFQDDEFLDMDNDDEDDENQQRRGIMNQQIIPQQSSNNLPDLDKYLNRPASQKVTLYDHDLPFKEKNNCLECLKSLDVFKNQAQLTLNGQRDVKSIFGGIFFFILVLFVILVAQYFVGIYLRGDDYTVSYQRYFENTINQFDLEDKNGQVQKDITFTTGKNFKFAVSFYKKTHYYPYNVSTYFGSNGPLGLKAINVTTTRNNGVITTTQTSINLVPCTLNYVNGWIGQYTNDQFYNSDFQNSFCIPDGNTFVLTGKQQNTVHRYFKISLVQLYGNSTGTANLSQFVSTYITKYYMSDPIKDVFGSSFRYQMKAFSLYDAVQKFPVQRNLTFTKLIFTDKYKQISRQSYNDDTSHETERVDSSSVSGNYTHNLTFYYSNIVDRYTLNYPGGAQLFGIVGGIIVFFIFGFGCIVSSFNNYKMKYLIGKKLYRFDKTSTGVFKDSKKKKTNLKKIQSAIKQINNYDQLQLLWSWALNPIAYIRSNYNFDKTLRRVTLIQQRVEKDINLFNFYTMLNGIRDAINKKIKLSANPQVKICSIFPKHIYHQEKLQASVPILHKQTRKNNLSPFDQIKISKAIDKRLNPSVILGGNKVLNRAFGLEQGSSVTGTMNESMAQTFMTRGDRNQLNNSASKMNQYQQQSRSPIKEEQKKKPLIQSFEIEQNDD